MSIVILNFIITSVTKNRIYTDTSHIPKSEFALILGNGPGKTSNPNPYFVKRMEGAYKLYKDKKVNYFLVSGKNSSKKYNEPKFMQKYLEKIGIPKKIIFLDYAGFRTLDSIVRSKKVFQLNKYVIITQKWHCARSVFIAQHNHIDAICYGVSSPKGKSLIKLYIREVFARVKAFIDLFIMNTQPKYLGKKENIQQLQKSDI